jgi:hypothetical protein
MRIWHRSSSVKAKSNLSLDDADNRRGTNVIQKNAKMAANLDKGQWPIRAATFNPIGREYLIREGFVA